MTDLNVLAEQIRRLVRFIRSSKPALVILSQLGGVLPGGAKRRISLWEETAF